MSGEGAFIDGLRVLATHPSARGLLDDAAVLEVGGETLVLTHDAMVEGTHFLPDQDMADVAWKLVATNLSDLAAKGAVPVGVLLAYTLGPGDDCFRAGLGDALTEYDCPLLGGDTVSGSGARTFGMTAIGRATHTPVPGRGGVGIGDALYITGRVGAAMLGFEALRADTSVDSSAYRRPLPLLKEGQLLAPIVTAMMDVSDGVLLDASRMATASERTLSIDTGRVPIATEPDRRAEALRWGDDYQLLFTAPSDRDLPLLAYRIGVAIEQRSHPLLIDGQPPAADDTLGYHHEECPETRQPG